MQATGDEIGRYRSEGTSSDSITLTWTAVGDDDSTGVATTYDLRYAISAIAEDNWESAAQVPGEPDPQPAGQIETVTVGGLAPGTTYYFGLKVADEVPNWSGWSNVVALTTLPLPPIADFECDGTSGAAPYTVIFNDLSQSSPTSWLWSFGDSATSSAQFPTHTFSEAGIYTVALCVANTGGADTLTVAGCIEVQQEVYCVADCDIDVAGTRTGTFLGTHESDDVYETIEEVESHGNKRTRYSCLEHKWLIAISQIALHLEAHHSANDEADDFVFSYSLNDQDFTDLLIVSKTIDDDTIQSVALPHRSRALSISE